MPDPQADPPTVGGEKTVDIGEVVDGAVRFPPWGAPTDKPTGEPSNPSPIRARVGFAVVGLGRLSLEQVLPAFQVCKHAKLSALVSGTPAKLEAVAGQYDVPAERCFSYEDFDRVAEDPDIQAVYVVLPNALHEAFVARAARAGKHVLCEKPMTTDSASAERMIRACEDAGRLLMVAYRSQYEPHLRDAIRLARGGELGRIKLIDALNIQNQGDPEQWRHSAALAGGGSLPDVGLYCLNIVRAITGEEPIEVQATIVTAADDPRFREIEDQVNFSLRFPSGRHRKLRDRLRRPQARATGDQRPDRLDRCGKRVRVPGSKAAHRSPRRRR